ncbi:type II secretion system protein [Lachnospiraceae bacterium OM04-12BH]|nr:type II secretion system protein [Lachnospiraceae bacterium OM04-12BH]
MKKQKSMGNKGFSLVELIIVIAIMAILVGVMAPQLMKYVEKSRVSADTQVADTVRTAIMTAMLDPSVTATTLPTTVTDADSATIAKTSDANAFGTLVEEILGDTTANAAKKLKSKAYTGQKILYSIDANNNVSVKITANSGSSEGNLVIPEPTTATP